MEERIVVLLHHGLGDVMMSRKLIINLRTVFLNNEIVLVVKSLVEKNFLDLLGLDCNFKIIVLDYDGTYISKAFLLFKFVALRWQNIKVLLAVHSSSQFFGNLLAKIIRARISIGPQGGMGYTRTVQWGSFHKKDYYFEFLSIYAKYFVSHSSLKYKITEAMLFKDNYVDLFPKKYRFIVNFKYIIITPGTSPYDTHKRWPIFNFVSLVGRMLEETQLHIVLMGTKTDSAALNIIAAEYINESRVIIVDDLKIRDALFIISRCGALVSACTSALHMGDLVGAKMVSLYGPTNYSVTGPTSNNNRIVRVGYSCSPCFREQFTAGCGLPRCMLDIRVDDVMIEINKVFKNDIIPSYPHLITTDSKSFRK